MTKEVIKKLRLESLDVCYEGLKESLKEEPEALIEELQTIVDYVDSHDAPEGLTREQFIAGLATGLGGLVKG